LLSYTLLLLAHYAPPSILPKGIQVIATLQASSLVEIIPASSRLFTAALELYRSRGDKDWGLTDCASFVVMSERGLSEALTTDDHFRQAGFRALLLENTTERP